MKSLKSYIQEKLIIKKSNKQSNNNYKYFPKTKEELKDIIKKRIKQEGNEVDLNDIDVSEITDMSELFRETNFKGDISNWNVSNVTDMSRMFWGCKEFNQDISVWNVSNVTDMSNMFDWCEDFNQDISGWDVSNVTDMSYMFGGCENFNQDLSSWNVSNVKEMESMFLNKLDMSVIFDTSMSFKSTSFPSSFIRFEMIFFSSSFDSGKYL